MESERQEEKVYTQEEYRDYMKSAEVEVEEEVEEVYVVKLLGHFERGFSTFRTFQRKKIQKWFVYKCFEINLNRIPKWYIFTEFRRKKRDNIRIESYL